MFRVMSLTGTLSWRPIEAKDVPACTVLLAAIEEADHTGDTAAVRDHWRSRITLATQFFKKLIAAPP